MENDKAFEIAQAKGLRGNIINTLYAVYPQNVSTSTLKSMLRYKGINSESDIKKALYYLEGRKYVYIEHEEDYWDSSLVLLPCGINLAEGDFNDIGVSINE